MKGIEVRSGDNEGFCVGTERLSRVSGAGVKLCHNNSEEVQAKAFLSLASKSAFCRAHISSILLSSIWGFGTYLERSLSNVSCLRVATRRYLPFEIGRNQSYGLGVIRNTCFQSLNALWRLLGGLFVVNAA